MAGAYVHIPFCTRRCDYCAFATWDDRFELVDRYVEGVRREISAVALAPLDTVFFGGGTPSLLTPTQLGSILSLLPLADGAEVTVECNPDTVDAEKLGGYRDAGVNRISLGVQSMVPHVLAALGRSHDPDNVARAFDAIRAVGFASFNTDLIYGSVGESLADWERTVRAVLELDPPHVSAYALTVEAGTPLAADPARRPDDDLQADMYALVDDLLGAAGLSSYEISNWSRVGHECRHNWLYWSQGDYRGFGCAAHSHVEGRRWWNVRTPERYLSLVEADRPPEGGAEDLGADERAMESLQLALRTRDGVPVHALPVDELGDLV
ncbi:MAG TPA: radical SAM family heme chaperone HemW, partial [Acidimicrobiales bacterium]|nr:radical SAM family heme chaperone HemW [Acidimicrobiales bacterium]